LVAEIHGANFYTPLREYTVTTSEVTPGISIDEFQALEQKVLRAVEIVKREREARAAAEAEVAALREQLDALTGQSNATQSQITTLHQEREAVRARVERMLEQMDELL
jgi:chromosome segregation ATPase